MFGDYLYMDADFAIMPYDEITSFDPYKAAIQQQLVEYNQLMNAKMDIVIFRSVLFERIKDRIMSLGEGEGV